MPLYLAGMLMERKVGVVPTLGAALGLLAVTVLYQWRINKRSLRAILLGETSGRT